jgi:hypothetical protein
MADQLNALRSDPDRVFHIALQYGKDVRRLTGSATDIEAVDFRPAHALEDFMQEPVPRNRHQVAIA